MLGSRLQIASLVVVLGTMVVGALSAQTASGASVANTLGFEDEMAWSLTEGSGAIDFVPDGTQGELSLLLGGAQWRRITSVNLTDAPATSNTATLDVKLLQPVASWESLGLVVQIPSRGIYWQDLGQVPLSQATPNQFTTLSFLLPEAVRNVIHQGGYNDLKILVSANSNAAIVLDNLSFGFPNQGGGPPAAGENATMSFATGTVLAPYR